MVDNIKYLNRISIYVYMVYFKMNTKTRKEIYLECCFPKSHKIKELNMNEKFVLLKEMEVRTKMARKYGCPKSYSGEHSFMPYGKDKIKCVHCGKTQKLRKPK